VRKKRRSSRRLFRLRLGILKRLLVERELSIAEVAALLPRYTNDHRDFYPLASLVKAGYVDVPATSNGRPYGDRGELELAINLYMTVQRGGAETFEYMGITSTGGDFSKEKMFATVKAEEVFADLRAKRIERIWAFAIGILTAALSVALTTVVGASNQ
jgi:hypothetical protein